MSADATVIIMARDACALAKTRKIEILMNNVPIAITVVDTNPPICRNVWHESITGEIEYLDRIVSAYQRACSMLSAVDICPTDDVIAAFDRVLRVMADHPRERVLEVKP